MLIIPVVIQRNYGSNLMPYFTIEDDNEPMTQLTAMVKTAGLANTLWALEHICRVNARSANGSIQTAMWQQNGNMVAKAARTVLISQ